MLDAMAQEILSAHNKYRAEVGVPPLEWSDDLAKQAQEWADYLAANLLFQHSGVIDQGENIWIGTSHSYSFTQMIDSFGDEKQQFVYGIFPTSATLAIGVMSVIIPKSCGEIRKT